MKSMKERGLRLALATLLFSLVCAPCAFAAGDGESVSGESNFTSSTDSSPFSASTTITFGVKVDQIAASVPLNMTVVAKAGGGPLIVPSNYTLKNKSPMDIHVASVTSDLSATSGGWVFGTTDYAASIDPADKTKNEITFKLLSGKGAGALILNGTTQTTTGTNWNVAAGSITAPTPLNLDPSGSTSKLNTQNPVAGALKLTYVIAPGSLS